MGAFEQVRGHDVRLVRGDGRERRAARVGPAGGPDARVRDALEVGVDRHAARGVIDARGLQVQVSEGGDPARPVDHEVSVDRLALAVASLGRR